MASGKGVWMVIECIDNSNGAIILVNIDNVTTMVPLDNITRINFANKTCVMVFHSIEEIGNKIKAGGLCNNGLN